MVELKRDLEQARLDVERARMSTEDARSAVLSPYRDGNGGFLTWEELASVNDGRRYWLRMRMNEAAAKLHDAGYAARAELPPGEMCGGKYVARPASSNSPPPDHARPRKVIEYIWEQIHSALWNLDSDDDE